VRSEPDKPLRPCDLALQLSYMPLAGVSQCSCSLARNRIHACPHTRLWDFPPDYSPTRICAFGTACGTGAAPAGLPMRLPAGLPMRLRDLGDAVALGSGRDLGGAVGLGRLRGVELDISKISCN